MQFSNPDLPVKPFSFDKINLTGKFKAAVNLFAGKPEWLTRSKPESVEHIGKKTLKLIPSFLRCQIADRNEAVT